MSMQLVLQQILVIFCYVAVGVGAGKLGIIDPEQRKYLTKLCSGLILPFTILSAASMELGAEGLSISLTDPKDLLLYLRYMMEAGQDMQFME